MTGYIVYDVFTDKPFGGNQLAVFPHAGALHHDRLQSIAAEFNFSEVTFIYPPDDPAHTAKVRIFTPTQEIPFAGHPTIGTAIALSDLGHGGDMVLELGVGPVACTVTDGMAQFTTPVPLEVLARPDIGLIADALGLPIAAIDVTEHVPTQATLGLPFVLAAVGSRQNLTDIQTVIDQFRTGAARYPTPMDFAIFAYWPDGDTLHARMFAPLDNIPEDPATGSACATLAALLRDVRGADQRLIIHQGVDMGRPSVIHAHAHASGVTISGQAVRTMEGRFVV